MGKATALADRLSSPPLRTWCAPSERNSSQAVESSQVTRSLAQRLGVELTWSVKDRLEPSTSTSRQETATKEAATTGTKRPRQSRGKGRPTKQQRDAARAALALGTSAVPLLLGPDQDLPVHGSIPAVVAHHEYLDWKREQYLEWQRDAVDREATYRRSIAFSRNALASSNSNVALTSGSSVMSGSNVASSSTGTDAPNDTDVDMSNVRDEGNGADGERTDREGRNGDDMDIDE